MEVVITGGADRYVNVYEVTRNMAQRGSLRCDGRVIRMCALPPAPTVLCCLGSGKSITVDARSCLPVEVFTGHTDNVLDSYIAKNGKACLTCGDDKRVLVYRM